MSRTSFTPVSFWEWAQASLLAANLAWSTLCLGGFLAETKTITIALTAALVLVHGLAWVLVAGTARGDCDKEEPVSRGPRIHPAGLLFVPFLIYAAANVLWITPVRWLGWADWFNWAQLFAVFWVVLNGIRSGATQRALLATLFALAVVSVLMACYQRFIRPDWLMLGRLQAGQYAGRASGCFGIPNSFAALLLLLIPLSGALALRRDARATARVFFGWLTLVLAFGLVLTISRGAWIGLAFALAGWPVFAARRPLVRRFALATGTLAALGLLGAVVIAVSPQVRGRFSELVTHAGERSRPVLWRAGWNIFTEQPVFGSGAGSYNVFFEKHRPEGFLHEPHWAHNDYLNTLSDYGSLGFLLFFGATGAVVVGCVRRSRRMAATRDPLPVSRLRERELLDQPVIRQALAVGLLAFGLQLFVDFHFKLPALAMAFACLSAIAVGRAWPAERRAKTRGRTDLVAAAVLVAIAGLYLTAIPRYRGEALRESARESVDGLVDEPDGSVRTREVLTRATAELDRALLLAPENAQAWADRAYVRAQSARLDTSSPAEAGRVAESEAGRAIALAPDVAEFWIRRGVARDMQGRWEEAGADFTHALSLSPKGVLPWYHYAFHLSLRATSLDMARALAQFCLRLDPSDRRSQQLRQRLATGS